MRFKIEVRSTQPPHHYLVRLADGRLIKDTMAWTGIHLKAGDTGIITNDDNGRPRIILDAIDLD